MVQQWNLNRASTNVVFFPFCIPSGLPPLVLFNNKTLWPLRTKGNLQMRRNSRLYYAYLNCSMFTCGRIIDVFCLDVTKCGEWLYNETQQKNCSIKISSAQMFGPTWSLDWGQLGVKRTDAQTQTHSWTAGRQNVRVTEINNEIRNKLKKKTGGLVVSQTGLLAHSLDFY